MANTFNTSLHYFIFRLSYVIKKFDICIMFFTTATFFTFIYINYIF